MGSATRDKDGCKVTNGDFVILVSLPAFLTTDLAYRDVRAIESQIGTTLKVMGINDIGWIELEFTGDDGVLRTIWVEGEHLKRA
ncbi:protein of unknown function [Candidatus Filomicrobium marinum]|uniref:Uncharacterized protein n=1 Tax=Candidatus Filomicrobium marinum TaxID=1608628 RepID=A0A0D6JE06_9HYPH|nr:protein of unknown function [Candidatus Filomicrobium marinum]CPR18071.1 protein of unknown function [Candidatus Filomicrobium marinum]